MWNNISITMKNCKEKYVSMRFNAVFTTMTVNNDDEDNQPSPPLLLILLLALFIWPILQGILWVRLGS